MRTSDSLAKISPDLVKALGALKGAPMVAENEAFKRKGKATTYATLESVIDATREVLAENHLCVIQAPGEMHDKVLVVTTRILHHSGEWIESDFHMPVTEWSPHKAGSATTYARRYALMAALNLAPIEDDDGNAASSVGTEKPDRPEPKQAAPKPLTLAQRADNFEATLKACAGDDEKLRKAYRLGAKLFDDLDLSDPERRVELAMLFEELLNEARVPA